MASAALAAVLVPLAACGGTGDAPEESESTATAEPSPTEKSGIAALVEAVDESTAEDADYTIEATATGVGEGSEIPATTNTYEVQGPQEPDRVTAVVPGLGEVILQSLQATGQDPGLTAEELSSVTMIVEPDGGDPIISNSHGGFPGRTEWVRGLDGVDKPAAPPLTPGELAPLLDELADEELIADEGAQELDGTPATLVEGEAEQSAVEDLGDARDTVEAILGGQTAGTLAFAAWVGEDGLPLRVEASDDEIEVELAFSAIGSTSFEAPAPEEIHDL